MSRTDRPFTLCETVSGVFAEICDKYAIDNSWLSWRFERAIWTGEASPLRFNTNDLVQKRPIKEGINKIMFEIAFDHENPNNIRSIRFNELPSRKVYLVTQTSIEHVREETKCPLWIELPPAARKEDIGAVQALLRVDICCPDWKDCLPKEPYTTLERAHLVVAADDIFWIKKQVIHKDMATRDLSNALETKIAEINELKKELDQLKRQLEEEKNASKATPGAATTPPSPAKKKPRVILTPKAKTLKKSTVPNTAPAKAAGYDSRHLVPAQTPTKMRAGAGKAFDEEILYWS